MTQIFGKLKGCLEVVEVLSLVGVTDSLGITVHAIMI